jgi:SAM-dependent methyltransferase
MTGSGPYVFDNDSPHALDQHALLARLLDPITTDRLRRLKVGPGHQCLEVGAGAGSVARWLADQTRPGGGVLATDIDTRYLPEHADFSVSTHDITTDPLPARAFDLIHARLVLLHLPQRLAVLRRLLAALKPGGVLLLEEFDCGYAPVLSLPPDAEPAIFPRFNQALIGYLASAGADPRWGRHVPAGLIAAGFIHLDIEISLYPWAAGAPGCELHYSNSLHLRDGLHAHGAGETDLAALRTQLRTPGFVVTSYPIYSVSGRSPATPGRV